MQKTTLPGLLYYMPLRRFGLCIFLLSMPFLLTSCGGAKPSLYTSDYPLSPEVAYSPSGSLNLRIPEGWTAAEDKECGCMDVWLLKEDFSAAISLISLKADSLLLHQIDKNEIKALSGYSIELKKEKLKEGFLLIKEEGLFELNKKNYAAYQYQAPRGDTVRVVVLKFRDRYYELSATPAVKQTGAAAIPSRELFRIQQSVLTSIQ